MTTLSSSCLSIIVPCYNEEAVLLDTTSCLSNHGTI